MKPTKLEAVGSLLGDYNDLGYDPATDTMSYYRSQTPPKDSEIDAELIRLQAEYDAQEYARNRQAEYPNWGSQLEKIYDDGLTKWKSEMVDPVKAKWPKDNSGPK